MFSRFQERADFGCFYYERGRSDGSAAERTWSFRMNTSRLKSIGFSLFWLGILMAFYFGSSSASGLIVYALLAILVGLKQSRLTLPGDGRSVTAALALSLIHI